VNESQYFTVIEIVVKYYVGRFRVGVLILVLVTCCWPMQGRWYTHYDMVV